MGSEDKSHDVWVWISDGDLDDKNEGDDDEDSSEQVEMESDDDHGGSDFGVLDAGVVGELQASSCRPQASYTVARAEEVSQRQEKVVSTIRNFLSISRAEAGILLRFFNWNVDKIIDEWFADEERVRQTVGLIHGRDQQADERRSGAKELTCGTCLKSHSLDSMKAAPATPCGHFYCDTCLTAYVHTAINAGPRCLTLHCADPSCGAAIGEDTVLSLVSREDAVKYKRFLLRNFLEKSKTTKWCPVPGCEYAVEYVPGCGSFDVVCKCSHAFCWNCLEEVHHPVDCETVAKWLLTRGFESEDRARHGRIYMVDVQPCPQCNRPVEKTLGCIHMTCTRPCEFEFCWVCLGAWTDHGERTGGVTFCKIYETAHLEGVDEGISEETRRRRFARNCFERYAHFHNRWAEKDFSRVKALYYLEEEMASDIERLSDTQRQPESQLKFLKEAWLQIVECQRILKWTSVYEYYLPDNDHMKRCLFEFVQEEAEFRSVSLHRCAEEDSRLFLERETKLCFQEFRVKLAGLTHVVRTHFENFVRSLENGLEDVDMSQINMSTLEIDAWWRK